MAGLEENEGIDNLYLKESVCCQSSGIMRFSKKSLEPTSSQCQTKQSMGNKVGLYSSMFSVSYNLTAGAVKLKVKLLGLWSK